MELFGRLRIVFEKNCIGNGNLTDCKCKFSKFASFLEWQPCHYSPEVFKKAIAENGKLGHKYANFAFFFLSINKFALV